METELPSQGRISVPHPSSHYPPATAFVLTLMVLLAALLVPPWAQAGTLRQPDMVRQILSPWVLPALGLALVMRHGGIDLSVWVVFTLGAIVSARLTGNGAHPLAVLAAVLAVGVAFGIVHALGTARLRLPSWAVTLATAAAGMWLGSRLSGGEVLTLSREDLTRWPATENELYFTGAFILGTIVLVLNVSTIRHVRHAGSGSGSLSAAMIASGALSALGGLCWLLKDGRTPMPGHLVADLRVLAAAVLAGAASLRNGGRSALVCMLVPFTFMLATIWWEWVWPTQDWPVDLNLVALTVMAFVPQWAYVRALRRPGWVAKLWPTLAALGLLSLAASAAPRAAERDVPRTALGVGLWLLGSGVAAWEWYRRRRPARRGGTHEP